MKRYNLVYPPTGERVELLEGFEEERDRLLGRGWEELEPVARKDEDGDIKIFVNGVEVESPITLSYANRDETSDIDLGPISPKGKGKK